MVPEGWSHRKLAEILCRVVDPVEVDQTDIYQEIGIRSHGKGLFHKEPVQGEKLGNKRVFWVKSDCLIVNIVFAWEQAVARTTKEEVGKIASHRFPMYRSKDGKADVDFLTYYFKTPHGKRLLELASPGGAGRNKTLGQKEFGNIKLLLPPGREQQKIARILSTWDKAIETVEKLIENSKKQKKALMQQLLTGKRRLPGFSEDWKMYSLINLASNNRYSFTGGPFGSDLKAKDYTKSGVRIIQLQNIGDGAFLDDYKLYTSRKKADELQSCNIFPGDIILAKMGDPVARATIIPKDESRYLMASDGIRLEVDQTRFDVKFVCELINHYDFRKAAVRRSTGSTRQRISLTELRELRLKSPCLAEQKKISQVLQRSDIEIKNFQQQHQFLQQQKKALMQQLLTGKRRVKVDAS